jgi:hypothetical protein
LYNALDGAATPPAFTFSATNSAGTAHEGDELRAGGPVTLRVHSNAPAGFSTMVWNGGAPIGAAHVEPEFAVTVPPDPAAYWIGIRAPAEHGDVMWLRSNPIFVRSTGQEGRERQEGQGRLEGRGMPERQEPREVQQIFDGKSTNNWHVEHDATSLGALDLVTGIGGQELRLRYGLSAGMASSPFVSLAYDVPQGTAAAGQLRFTVRAQQPMRISVQARSSVGDGSGADRWQRSVYVSPADEERTIDFRDFVPAGPTSSPQLALDKIRAILFVVDTTNTKPGSSGRVWFKSVALAR